MTSLKSIAAKLSVADLLLIGKFQQPEQIPWFEEFQVVFKKRGNLTIGAMHKSLWRFEVRLHIVIKINGASQPLFLRELLIATTTTCTFSNKAKTGRKRLKA
ncbi:hypothetical protein [Segetibacter aerophilus]|uniref:hypothetical protein n=1 Tax=Segetibacter aerophilus TaxID=670293 RepID=UPI0011BD7D3A|nr:hypothetical protein [Segetibacter aerophilus]